MARVTVFNTNNILSVTTVQRIVSAVVILFVLQCVGAKDVYIFAQTTENEPDRVKVAPEVISETVEPVDESWGGTKGFGEKLIGSMRIFIKSHRTGWRGLTTGSNLRRMKSSLLLSHRAFGWAYSAKRRLKNISSLMQGR